MFRGRRAAVVVVLLTAFTMSLTGSALNLSIPGIGSDFGVEASTVGWMITGYMLTMAALSVPFGRWADITCRKTVLMIGMAIFIAACTVASFAGSFAVLLIGRIVQGVGAAMVLSCNVPILISAYPPQMRGKALGLAIGAVYVGLSTGPVIGGVLNQQLGWRSIFAFAGVLACIAFAVAVKGIKKEISEGKGVIKMDLAGSIIFGVFITMFMLGLSQIELGLIPAMIALAGLAVGVIFVKYELNMENPILDIRLFRNNIGYALSNVSSLINYAATFAIGYLTSIYLQVIMGYSSQTAGIIMIVQPAVMAIIAPKIGKMSDRYSPFKLSSFGMGLCAAGTVMFAFMRTDTSLLYIIGALVITGFGLAFFSPPNTNAILSCVEKKDYGVANSVVNTMRSIGQTLSMVIVTIIVSFMLPDVQLADADPTELVHVINVAFAVFAVLCVVGIFISLKRK